MNKAFDSETLLQLIPLIYDAALNDELWVPLIDRLGVMINASSNLLFSPQLLNNQVFQLSGFMDAELWGEYQSYYCFQDAWVISAREKGLLAQGSILHGDQGISRRELRKTEIYCDYMKPKMKAEVIMSTILFDETTPEQSPPMALSFYRPPGGDSFSLEDEANIRPLLPHLQRALKIRWQLNGERQARQLREQALQHVNAAVLLLDESGCLLFANRQAENLLRTGEPIIFNRRLATIDVRANNAIKQALRQAAAGIGSTVRFDNPPPIGPRIASFMPVQPENADLHTRCRVLVMIAEPGQANTGNLQAFASLYGLTPAETRVLQALLQQQTPREIAIIQQVSIKTIRTQLSALFAKTQTKNQRDLVRFCLGHPAMPLS